MSIVRALTHPGMRGCAPGQTIGPNGTCAWAGSNPGASALLNATGEYSVSASVCEAIQSGSLTLSNGATQDQLSNCVNQGYSTPSAALAPPPLAPAPTFISMPAGSSGSVLGPAPMMPGWDAMQPTTGPTPAPGNPVYSLTPPPGYQQFSPQTQQQAQQPATLPNWAIVAGIAVVGLILWRIFA